MKIKLFYFICLITVMSCGLEDGNINLSEDNRPTALQVDSQLRIIIFTLSKAIS